MKNVLNGSGAQVSEVTVPTQNEASQPHDHPPRAVFTPVAVEARPFHALHGAYDTLNLRTRPCH